MRSVWGSFPGVSHVGRQSRFYSATTTCRIAPRVHFYRGRARKQSTVPQSKSLLRTSAWPEEPLLAPPVAHVIGEEINARLWVLNLSDGEHSLLDIAERSGIPFSSDQRGCESALPERAAVGGPGRRWNKNPPQRKLAREGSSASFLAGSLHRHPRSIQTRFKLE